MDLNLVSASEEEEVDYFSQMPNFRWTNETTTTGTEEMIDSGYSVDTTNLDPIDTAKFEKSRLLNSRDFYTESRFALDSGGDEIEYFKDVLGESVNFNDDSLGVWGGFQGTETFKDGIVTCPETAGWTWIASHGLFDKPSPMVEVFTASYFRLWTATPIDAGDLKFYVYSDYDDGTGGAYGLWNYPAVSVGWNDLWIDLTTEKEGAGRGFTKFQEIEQIVLIGAVSGINVKIDIIKLFAQLDYASFVEGELEDTWDFEDSKEYFYDEMNNLSDFNDGTGENWTAFDTPFTEGFNDPVSYVSYDGFYVPQNIRTIDASYTDNVLTSSDRQDQMGIWEFNFNIPSTATITGLEVAIVGHCNAGDYASVFPELIKSGGSYVSTGEPIELFTPYTDHTYYWGGNGDLWGETWTYADINDNTDFKMKIWDYWTSGSPSVEPDLNWAGIKVYYEVAGETAFSTSKGWGNITAITSTDELVIKRSDLSIDADTYGWFTSEVYVESGTITNMAIYDSEDNLVGTDGTNYGAGEWALYSLDLDIYADWNETETELTMLFTMTGSADTHQIDLNMTHLYDVELGDLEGFQLSNSLAYAYVNPEGYFTGFIDDSEDGTAHIGLVEEFDIDVFTGVEFKIKASSSVEWRDDINDFYIYDATWAEIISYQIGGSVGTDWTVYDLLFEDFNAFPFSEGLNPKQIYWGLEDISGYVHIDYVLITGEFAPSKLKFSVLNSDSEEMGYFGFSRHNETFYNLSVEFYDSLGSYLTYEDLFSYNSPEWLRMDLELDLDKKDMKFELMYDNGTEIFELNLHEMFGYLGRQQPIIFGGSWFPTWCINNSQAPMSRSAFVIDFINANYDIIDIRQPVGSPYPTYIWAEYISEQTTDWGFNPFGMMNDGTEQARAGIWCTLNIDKLDGFSFDYLGSVAGLDEYLGDEDTMGFILNIQNVQPDGSLITIGFLQVIARAEAGGMHYDCVMTGGGGIEGYSVDGLGDLDFQGKFSFYYENEYSAYAQIIYELDGVEQLAVNLHNNEESLGGYKLTKEFQFTWIYVLDNDVDGYNNDFTSFAMGGMDITRKDFLGDIAGSIVKGFTDIVGLILAPFILIFQFLAFVLKGVGDLIIAVLEPILEGMASAINGIAGALGTILTEVASIAGEITSGLTSLGTAITESIGGIATAVWEGVGSALDFITDAIVVIGSDLITALITSLSEIVEDLLGFLIEFVTVLNELTELLFDFVINSIIMPIIVDFFAGLGLSWLLDDLLVLIENLGDVLINLVGGAMALLSWLVITVVWVLDNGDLIGLVLGLFVAFFLFRPMLYFLETPFEDWFTSQGIDQIEETSRRFKELFLIVFNLIITFFELIFRLLTTIGSYIPFT